MCNSSLGLNSQKYKYMEKTVKQFKIYLLGELEKATKNEEWENVESIGFLLKKIDDRKFLDDRKTK